MTLKPLSLAICGVGHGSGAKAILAPAAAAAGKKGQVSIAWQCVANNCNFQHCNLCFEALHYLKRELENFNAYKIVHTMA